MNVYLLYGPHQSDEWIWQKPEDLKYQSYEIDYIGSLEWIIFYKCEQSPLVTCPELGYADKAQDEYRVTDSLVVRGKYRKGVIGEVGGALWDRPREKGGAREKDGREGQAKENLPIVRGQPRV